MGGALSGYELGQVYDLGGQLMRYVGDGRFEPAGLFPPDMIKRFEGGGPLLGGQLIEVVEGEGNAV